MIEIVSATRLSEGDFWQKAALGLSLKRLTEAGERLAVRVTYENKAGLPEIFNRRIQTDEGPDALVFMHDDVWIDDYFLVDRVLEGLRHYDVIGVAGNRRRRTNQPAWAFVDDAFTWDTAERLSGRVAHGEYPFGELSVFGEVPAACELLDGVFLAARRTSLKNSGVLFDERFDFHFYDMDFCRSARARGLRLGTWPICLTHQSGGGFNSPAWHEKLRLYREKWGA